MECRSESFENRRIRQMRMTGNWAILSNQVPIVANGHLDMPSNPIRPSGANHDSSFSCRTRIPDWP
jgi:hypothetical protein